uniref:Aromatic amino acid beta-eliminating lyase/threonine aldolase domain-containing protein n=1 Tax=Glossina brevipalpis TaxID=37001 RepID=A0A1A9WPR7_9MUSC
MSLPNYIIDMRSDTVSLPTIEMREAMFTAAVGDDVYGEDPTVLQLEQKSIDLFKKEAALFVPSGTMANLLAIMVHCHRRGSEAIAGDLSHTFLYEQAGAAQIAGVQLTTIQNRTDGTFCLEELQRKMHLYKDCHEPLTSLVIVENTHNMCGGKVLPLQWLDELTAICKNKVKTNDKDIALHMDGARIFNASQYLNESVARITRDFDSVCFCLSKGLSAPVGSVLLGSKAFIAEARHLRKVLGGSMRQCGVLAAAGLVALEKIVPLLREDHRRTKLIAEAINNLHSDNFHVDLDNVHTNILLIHMVNPKVRASTFAKRLFEFTENELNENITTGKTDREDKKGIQLKVSSRDWTYARLVLYNQITDKDVEYAIKKIEYVIQEYDNVLGLNKIS